MSFNYVDMLIFHAIHHFFIFQAECPPIQMEPVDLTVNKSDDGSRRNCESPEDESNSLMMDQSTSDSEDSSPSSFSRSWNSLLWGGSSSTSPSTCIDLRVKKGKHPFPPSSCKLLFFLQRKGLQSCFAY